MINKEKYTTRRRPNAINKLLDFETLRNPNLYRENKTGSHLRENGCFSEKLIYES